MRNVKVAAAQLGPIQKADSRQAVVARMIDLMRQAEGCDLIVYPELALTTFFPRWYCEDRSDADIWFEREMPNAATRPLFEEAKRAAIAMSFGYAELTPDGYHFNTSILVDKSGKIVGKYRKVHLPGHDEFDPSGAISTSKSATSSPATSAFWCGACWAACSACASATTGAGRRRFACSACKVSRW